MCPPAGPVLECLEVSERNIPNVTLEFLITLVLELSLNVMRCLTVTLEFVVPAEHD